VSESPKSATRDEHELDGEEVDALPVLVDEPHVLRVRPGGDALSPRPAGAVMPAVQAAAVAAGGFVAGAAVVGRRLARRNRAGAQRSNGRAAELVQIVGSRSFLVDVHLLGGSGDR
jgi:hypothetical protein